NTLNLTDHLRESLPTLLSSEFQTTLTDEPLHVSTFLQKNKIVVNENGLEAASVTEMCAKGQSTPPKPTRVIDVDHPFAFLLYKGIGKNENTGGSKDFLFLF